MLEIFLLLLVGFCIGTIGTLVGVGGGFILVPILLIFYPELRPQEVTAISMAVVAINSIFGSFGYYKSKRIDFRAGILFALCAIPGSVLGVFVGNFIPKNYFDFLFGGLLIILSLYLLTKKNVINDTKTSQFLKNNKWKTQIIDSQNIAYLYNYDFKKGIVISFFVGLISPIFGIGGGIVQVPAMIHVLHFPVVIATATSQFMLAITSIASVIANFFNGNYNNFANAKMIVYLAIGVLPGVQFGIYLSKKIGSKKIMHLLAICLFVVGLKIISKYY